MSRASLKVTILAVLAACQVQTPKYPSPEQMAQRAKAATVGLAVICPDGNVQMGSGTITRPNRIVTAAHVLECDAGDPAQVIVEYLDDQGKPTQVLATGYKQLQRDGQPIDAAVVTVAEFLPNPVKEASVNPVDGAEVCLAAYLPNRLWACTAVEETENYEAQVAQAVYPGNSGGGAYNDAGELIGVIVQSTPCRNQRGTVEICGGVVLVLVGATD